MAEQRRTTEDLIEPEGVDAGGPVAGPVAERAEAVGERWRGHRSPWPPLSPPGSAEPNGELLSCRGGLPRPPQPGQELSAGEG